MEYLVKEIMSMECLVVVLGKFAEMKDLVKEWLLMVAMQCQVWGVDRCSP